MIAALTGMGLSAAAGFNAYIPFLIVALVARFSDFITLPQSYAWIESWWADISGASSSSMAWISGVASADDTV